eukprot:TRINITY_DN21887_c0_g1_i1.p1 TRINITY_DN21887_c0_g1~~TRINITY_DN21887_c0_g1_i1.p1  ORF type:complete len:259 (+),score=57.94 TRINITY_DN21887_c0_g1_i1:156-932(+)
MATLGYRDSGSVVLSKAEALRQQHEDESNKPKSRMTVFSRRKSPPKRRRDDKDEKDKKQASEFVMNVDELTKLRPEKRLKWLQKAMLMVGMKTIKADDFFQVVMDAAFVSEVPPAVGKAMKAQIHANLHLFSTKHQKAFKSESCQFNNFKSSGKEPKEPKDKSTKEKDRDRRRDRDEDNDSDDERGRDLESRKSDRRRRRDDSRSYSEEEEDEASRRPARRTRGDRYEDDRRGERDAGDRRRDDRREYARGAADDNDY